MARDEYKHVLCTDIARGTLEKVVNLHPQRHAHTWPRTPCHCIWVLYSVLVFVGVPLEPTNVHALTLSRGESVEVPTPC